MQLEFKRQKAMKWKSIRYGTEGKPLNSMGRLIQFKELLKQLAEEGLLSPGKEQNTKSIRINEKSKRLACIYKSKAQQIYDGAL